MALYFLHLRDGTDELLDEEGLEVGTMDALRKLVLTNVRDIIAGDVQRGIVDFRFRIDAEDRDGTIVYTLPFEHAINVIPDGPLAGQVANDTPPA